MIRPLLACLILLLPAACADLNDAQPPVTTTASVDLNRYAGTWYEIARIPNDFQDGGGRACDNVTATYTPLSDGTVEVVNRCLNGAAERVATGTARVVPGSGNAKLRVSFFWPFFGDYWVLGLDPNYRWAVVGAPNREFLWVLARSPVLRYGDYAQAIGIARAQGFDVNALRTTPQPSGAASGR